MTWVDCGHNRRCDTAQSAITIRSYRSAANELNYRQTRRRRPFPFRYYWYRRIFATKKENWKCYHKRKWCVVTLWFVPYRFIAAAMATLPYITQFNCWFLSALQMKPNWYDFAQKWILIRMNKYDQEDETGQSDLLGVIGRALPTFPSDGDERLLSSVTYSHPSMINKIQINETTRRDDG